MISSAILNVEELIDVFEKRTDLNIKVDENLSPARINLNRKNLKAVVKAVLTSLEKFTSDEIHVQAENAKI